MVAHTNRDIGFKPRILEFRAKQAVRLLGAPQGAPITPLQFRSEAGDVKTTQKQGATYHNVYSPLDIRRVREKLDPEFMQLVQSPVNDLPPFVCLHLTKGGVGKSSTTANLGASLAAQGYKVLIIDGDPEGSTTQVFGVDNEVQDLLTLRNIMKGECTAEDAVVSIYQNAHLDLIPADNYMTGFERELAGMRFAETRFVKMVQDQLRPFFSQYEIVLMDTAPASSILNFNLMIAASMILGVVSLDGMSLKSLDRLDDSVKDIEAATERPLPVMLVANKMHQGHAHCQMNFKKLTDEYGDVMCQNVIPTYTGFDKQVDVWDRDASRPIYEREPHVPAAEVFLEISRVLLNKLIIEPRRRVAQAADSVAAAA